ncbi:MAG: hypothetical protein COU40_03050 [Candidatus Moranbacteria bacterium CG10_big_fil_rev_8_21_14_0_10_35_21]|nr:MAG: hypothetical protein COU40_03050 [Candidatus Moranbacteria bacterium CG10_big_fil_rev_8_21_14_0_10_35_21]
MKKPLLLFLLIITTGIFFNSISSPAHAAVSLEKPTWEGLVPCGRNSGAGGETQTCTLCDLILGIKRLVQYGLYLVTTIAFVGIFISGLIYILSSGDESMITQAKGFMTASLIGFTVVISAWLIINVSLWIMSAKPDLGIQKSSWYQFSCGATSSAPTNSAP